MYGIETLKYVVNSLNELQMDYMIGGSHVMGLYANSRTTRDIDIIINFKESDFEKFIELFSAPKFHININAALAEIKRKGMFNIVSEETGYKIDFIIHKESEFYNEQFKRKRLMQIFGLEAWVCSKEDLIVAKLMWIQQIESELQKRDIADLLDSDDVDLNYINSWIQKLNLKTYGLI